MIDMPKRFSRFAIVFLFLAIFTSSFVVAQKKLTGTEAQEHIGEEATVCGDVVSARYASTSNGAPTFLNLDKPYPGQVFTVVIWGKDRHKFGKPEEDYQGKRICVNGKITAYAGKAEILASDPKQISLDRT